ncbi:MAG: hypothetical protein WC998_00710 [Candidatus Paceibacterota bacterium]|jgi:hypothetical protein
MTRIKKYVMLIITNDANTLALDYAAETVKEVWAYANLEMFPADSPGHHFPEIPYRCVICNRPSLEGCYNVEDLKRQRIIDGCLTSSFDWGCTCKGWNNRTVGSFIKFIKDKHNGRV